MTDAGMRAELAMKTRQIAELSKALTEANAAIERMVARRRVSADKIAVLLFEDSAPLLENISYLAVKIAEGIESGELLQ
jgi:hypothetical protein